MVNKSKAKGTAAETRIVNYLRAAGIECDRQPLKGNNDEGDIWFVDKAIINARCIIEVKGGKQTAGYSRTTRDLWINQTVTEVHNASETLGYIPAGFLVIAKHGANIADYEVWVALFKNAPAHTFFYLDDFVREIGGKPQEFKGGKQIG